MKYLDRAKRNMRLGGAAVTIIGLLAAGCASKDVSGRTASDARPSPRTVTVTLFADQPAGTININTDWFTKFAERKFHLKFKFDLVPSADIDTKQALVLASGNYPTAIWHGDIQQTDALNYGEHGAFLPLNRLIKKYAPNLEKVIKTNQAYREAVTAPNGKIYALPSLNFSFSHSWGTKLWIDVKLLDKFGLRMPRTTQQFAHVLAVCKQHGIIPYDGSPAGLNTEGLTTIMNAFVPYNGDLGSQNGEIGLDVNSKKEVYAAAAQPGFEQGLKYLHQLYQDGDFSKTLFTQPLTTLQRQLVSQDVCSVSTEAIWDILPNPQATPKLDLDWLAVPPLRGPKGVQSTDFNEGIPTDRFAITNKATKAQAAAIMRLMNFIWTPKGTEILDEGPSGDYWAPARKGEKGYAGTQALFRTVKPTPTEQNVNWYYWGAVDQGKSWEDAQAITEPTFSVGGEDAEGELLAIVDEVGHQPKYQYPGPVWIPLSENETYAEEETNLNNYVQEWVERFITGQKPIATDWPAYLAGLRSLGLHEFLKVSQQAMVSPVDSDSPSFQPPAGEAKLLLRNGSVPALDKKYLIESGVRASEFRS